MLHAIPATVRFWLVVLALALTGLTWHHWPDTRLHLTALPTPGDAFLLKTPAGRYILIDGGSDPVALTTALGRALPFWRHHLDAVILLRPERNWLTGQVAALERYSTPLALVAAPGKGALWQAWRGLTGPHTTVRALKPGQRFIFDGVVVQPVGKPDNLMLVVRYGSTSALLAHTVSDATALPDEVHVDMLAYPWEADPALPDGLRARFVIYTDGLTYDEPATATMAERRIGRAALYHEDLHGAIDWVSDGRQSWIAPAQ